jgi:probable F420-dependent oxidoreductase
MVAGLGVSHHTLVEGLRGHAYNRPLAAMGAYLAAMDASPYTSTRPTTPVRRVLAALGPKMLELAGRRSDGAHPYFVTPQHTAESRRILGEGPLLCPEQAVVMETDPERARAIARTHTKVYLPLPNYANNLLRLGFAVEELADGGSDRVVDSIVAWGDVDQIASRVQAHLDAGADHVAVQTLSERSRATPEALWRALAPTLTSLRSP